jgi:hypothetical protein
MVKGGRKVQGDDDRVIVIAKKNLPPTYHELVSLLVNTHTSLGRQYA